jgi:NTE family protein
MKNKIKLASQVLRRNRTGWLWLIPLLFLQGCATIYKPQNQSITAIDNAKGYRLVDSHSGDYGDHLIFLAFSGGGTRAAALSYGVLQELRDTQVDTRGHRVRLLDEVDSISSVSGGSFTAAYYGLFGDKTFSDYEKVFLRQSIEGALIRKLFNPVYWWRSLFSGFDRTEMAIEYYNSHIFERKTFADFQLGHGPYIEINATDLGSANRFAFIQAYFDLICSDLSALSVARAVTASSAVPVAFPTVVLKNYSGDCDINQSNLVRFLDKQDAKSLDIRELKAQVNSYTNRTAHPYIHLVDGGVADNLGLRALTDRIDTIGSGFLFNNPGQMPKDVLVISVNAQVTPEPGIDHSAAEPSVGDTINAFTDVQMSRYDNDTKLLLANKLKDLEKAMQEHGHNVRIYNAEVTFESIKTQTLKSYFNNLPTSLELSDHEVDMLIGAGRELLRNEPRFKHFLEANAGTRVLEAPPASSRAVSLTH